VSYNTTTTDERGRTNTHVKGPEKSGRKYLSNAAAAEYLDTSTDTLRRLVLQGRLRAYRLGDRGRRYAIADLDALLVPIEPADADDDD
jgi:excisionase family DNA binding protein